MQTHNGVRVAISGERMSCRVTNRGNHGEYLADLGGCPPASTPGCRAAAPTCRPQSQTVSLTHTAGSADLALGRDSWCQAGQTDQLLIWCG